MFSYHLLTTPHSLSGSLFNSWDNCYTIFLHYHHDLILYNICRVKFSVDLESAHLDHVLKMLLAGCLTVRSGPTRCDMVTLLYLCLLLLLQGNTRQAPLCASTGKAELISITSRHNTDILT